MGPLPRPASARLFTGRPRLLIAAVIGLAAGLLAPAGLDRSTRLLIGWDAGILVHLVLVAAMMATATRRDLDRRADREDAGAVVILFFFVLASLASVGAIGVELHAAREPGGTHDLGRVALGGVTVLLSWLFAHVLFGLHYAHDFYAGQDDRRGLRFPGESDPDYWDFMYFSFNLGAAAQTSDVQVEAPRMRRFVLLHTVVSFLFNTSILALAVNVGAGLL